MLLASFLLSCGENPQSQQGAAPPAFPVKVAVSIEREVHLTDVYTGRFAAVDQVELRPRVSGYVESVHFEEGQSIEAGQLMFQIDPRHSMPPPLRPRRDSLRPKRKAISQRAIWIAPKNCSVVERSRRKRRRIDAVNLPKRRRTF